MPKNISGSIVPDSSRDTPARVLSVPAVMAAERTSSSRLTEAADRVAAQRDVADMGDGRGGGDDTSWILDDLRRWQHRQQQQERKEHCEDHPEFVARRRHLVRSRSAMDVPDEVPATDTNII